jgi:SulP family sulfate permease
MVFQLDDHGLRLVGDIPSGLPMPGLPDVGLADIVRLLPVAAGIALVGYSDNVLTARSLAARHGYKIDANQELLALGLTNLASGLSRGFPISSSASRTAVPASLGSKTQLVSLLAATFVVGSLFGLRPLLGEIPRPALAAVIVAAAFSIIDVTGYRALWRVSREEAALAVITTLAVVIVGVLPGVVAAVVLSLLLAIWRLAHPQDAVLGEPGLVVFRFDAPLLFMNVDRFCERVHEALGRNPGDEEWVILDFEGVGSVDATALDALDELVAQLDSMGVSTIAVTRANREVTGRLHDARLLGPVGRLRSFPTILSAVRAFRARTNR